MAIRWSNNAHTVLAAPISDSATTLSVAPGTGALFPTLTGGDYHVLTLIDAATQTINEIVKVTAHPTADTMTIVRAQESTTARAWMAGDVAALLITAGTMQTIMNEIDAEDDAYLAIH